MHRLWKISGFAPFILATFINAFVDLGHKIVIQDIFYKVYDEGELTFLPSLVHVLIFLPFILFFSPSGFLADKFPKNIVMRVSAWVSVGLTSFIALCYFMGWFWLAFGAIFLMATQSAFYSPSKYGFIKNLVGKDLLAWGNGAMQAVMVVAILLGMCVFSFLFEWMYNLNGQELLTQKDEIIQSIAPLGLILIACSGLELYLSYRIPTLTKPSEQVFDKDKYLSGQLFQENLKLLFSHRNIWLSVVGITMFWSVTQLLLTTFPAYAKINFGEFDVFKIQSVMACSAFGVIVGSIIAGRFSKQYIETGLIPLGAGLVCLMCLMFVGFDSLTPYIFVFFLFGMGGALLIVPLNALIQFYAKEGELGRILAGSNFVQNIGILIFLGVGIFVSALNLPTEYLFYFCVLIVLCGTFYIVRLLPFSLVRMLVTLAFFQRYRLNVEGFENVPERGGVLLLGNHISFIDWAIVQLALPRKVYFVMEYSYYDRWYLRIFFDLFGVIPATNEITKNTLERIAQKLLEGHMVCIFPEGVISRHGHLNEFRNAFELVAKCLKHSDAIILPFYIRGLWGSSFSRSHESFRERRKSFAKRKVTIAFGESLDIHSSKERVKAKVFELSFSAWKSQCAQLPNIGSAWINSAKKWNLEIAIVDSLSGSMSYIRMLCVTMILSRMFARDNTQSQNVGIMLPASLASSLCNFSLLMAGKSVVNLNFTAGQKAIASAIDFAQISCVYTSRSFLSKFEDKGVQIEFPSNMRVYYMEDIIKVVKRNKIDFILKMIQAFILPAFMLKWLYVAHRKNTDVAAILFSSGSEGKPKGVMLSHLNIMSNILQISEVIHARNEDSILSSLPPFHAFGLTVTTLMPFLEGILSVTYPDPTDAVGIAKAVAKNKVSVMCGTSTFLGIYARNSRVDKMMFDSLRLVVAGAEKLKKDVQEAFVLKFNKNIYEGYGATETTPVVSVNLPNAFDVNHWEIHRASKEGSVGMPLPGSVIRIVDPDTMKELPVGEDGLILIGGHQVMIGYLNDEARTNEVIVQIDGIRWYKSGDKGHLDSDGFIHIVDRYSRFAKIGGEMVSLGGIEEEIAKLIKKNEIGEFRYVAVALEDSKKGESVVLLVSGEKSEYENFRNVLRESGIPPLFKPSKTIYIDSIPTLGSGKIDFKGAKDLAQKLLNA